MPPRFYIDEDPHQDLAATLRAAGYDALSTREAGNKGRSDARQLEFALGAGRGIVTSNAKDFRLLHEALVLWSRRVGRSDASAHAGVVVVPSGSRIDLPTTTRIVTALARSLTTDTLAGRLFEWLQRTGEWSEPLWPASP